MTTLDQALSDLRAAHEEIAGLKRDKAAAQEGNRQCANRLDDAQAAIERYLETGELDWIRRQDLRNQLSVALTRVELLEKDKAEWQWAFAWASTVLETNLGESLRGASAEQWKRFQAAALSASRTGE